MCLIGNLYAGISIVRITECVSNYIVCSVNDEDKVYYYPLGDPKVRHDWLYERGALGLRPAEDKKELGPPLLNHQIEWRQEDGDTERYQWRINESGKREFAYVPVALIGIREGMAIAFSDLMHNDRFVREVKVRASKLGCEVFKIPDESIRYERTKLGRTTNGDALTIAEMLRNNISRYREDRLINMALA